MYFYVIIDELASISELSHTLSNNETKMDENERTRRLEQWMTLWVNRSGQWNESDSEEHSAIMTVMRIIVTYDTPAIHKRDLWMESVGGGSNEWKGEWIA